MRTACLAFSAGAWWLQQQAQLMPAEAVLLLGASASCLAFAASRWRRCDESRTSSIARRVIAAIAAFAIGFAWASWRADHRLADALPHDLEGKDVVVVGTVAVLPALVERGVRFEFTVESVESRDAAGQRLIVPEHLALGWYAPRSGDASLPRIEPGQRWRLTVRLKRPHGAANPFGFDYEYWLLEEGLRATGYVRPGADDAGLSTDAPDESDTLHSPIDIRGGTRSDTRTRKLADFVWSANNLIERARSRLRDRVFKILADGKPLHDNAPYAGVIVALIVGDQRAIAQSDWIVFNRTGIGHLVSISGLHVSMLAALGAWLAFAIWRRHPAWCARLAAHKVAALAGTSVALGYCLLAGFGVPAQRTLYMIAVVALALWMHRLTSVSRVLCIALLVVTAIDPWAGMGAGFWLSFAAVAAIFYVAAGRFEIARPSDSWRDSWRDRFARSFKTAVRVQWAVTLALTPLTLLLFYQVSLIGPIANAIAIPLVSFVVTPLSLAGAVMPAFIGTWLLHAAHGLVALLAAWLTWLSAAPIAVWTGPAPGAWAFMCAMLGVAWWLAPRGVPSRWLGAFWMVPMFGWPADSPAPGTTRLTALDIGQGTSVLIETHSTRVLYDTGPQYAPDNDAGNRIIVPYLRARGIDRLDAVIVSHNDSDHSGGALWILQAMPVDLVRSSLTLESPIVRAATKHSRCLAGQRWTSDGVSFELMHPLPDVYAPREGKAPVKPNAKSCVLRVEAGGHSMLLTADIEKPQEAELVARDSESLRTDVLLVPHHGSRTSSSDVFLNATAPTVAIVQAGYLNRFGHPRPDVMARYRERAIPVLRNDADGAITVTLAATGVSIARYRQEHPRYWYGR